MLNPGLTYRCWKASSSNTTSIGGSLMARSLFYAMATVLIDCQRDRRELGVHLVRLVTDAVRGALGSCEHISPAMPFISPAQYSHMIAVTK